MRLRLFALAGFFLTATLPTFSQTAPAASQGGFPITVGYGYSNFFTDWSGHESGTTLWVDWNRVPAIHGLAIELQARDLDFDKTGDNPNLREVTVGGGPVYYVRRWGRIVPYAKLDIAYGRIDFSNRPGDPYTHDSRTVTGPGGGVEYRIIGNFWVRAEYEYQFWPHFLHDHTFNPKGLTFGLAYDLGRFHAH
jgi:opacity protein-like surface antigen